MAVGDWKGYEEGVAAGPGDPSGDVPVEASSMMIT